MQCNAQLSTLLETLTLVDPPTVDQLVVGESTVINVRNVLRESQVLSFDVAKMSPEIAGEVMGTSAEVTGACLKLEQEILIKISQFKREMSHPDPAPVHVPLSLIHI